MTPHPLTHPPHPASMVLGGVHFASTFTVLDQDNTDCLLGLDMLKRYVRLAFSRARE